MAATLGSLRLDIGLELAKFQSDMGKAAHITEQGMRRIEKLAGRVTHLFEALAIGAGIRKLAQQIQAAAEQGSKLVDLSQKTGQAIGDLSQLSIVAADAGIKFDDLSGALIKFNKSIADGAGGVKEQAAAFRLLGISQEDLKNSSPEKLLERVADQFKKFKDGPNEARLAIALFGREGADLIPLLNQGGEAIRQQKEEAEKLGLTLNEVQARQLKAFQDRLDKTGQITAAFRNHIAIGLTPALDALLKQFNDAATNADTFELAERRAAAAGKVLASSFIIIRSTLTGLGNTLGNVAAARAKFYEGANPALLLNPVTAAFEQMRLAAANGAAAIEILKEGGKDASAGLSDELSELSELWKQSGIEAEKGAAKINNAVGTLEAPNLEASLTGNKDADKRAAAIKRAREEIELLTQRLAAQVDAFGKSDTALLKYRLTQGDLADEMKLIGDEAGAMSERLLSLSATYDDLQKRQEREDELLQDAAALYDATRTPLEQFNNEVERLNELRDTFVDGEPLIDGETYARGIKQAQDALDEFNEDLKRSKQFAIDLNDGFRDAFDELFDDLRNGEASWKKFGDAILDMIFEIGKQQLLTSMFGQQGTSGGGWFSQLARAAGSYFGGTGDGGFGGSNFTVDGGLAMGGPAMPNSLYRVNENGPELASIGGKQYLMTGSAGGSVTPLRSAASESRPITVIQQITTPDIGSFKASAGQIAAGAFAAAQRNYARNR